MENKIFLLCFWNETGTDIGEIFAFRSLDNALEAGLNFLLVCEGGELSDEVKEYWYNYQDIDGLIFIYETEFED